MIAVRIIRLKMTPAGKDMRCEDKWENRCQGVIKCNC